MKEFRLKKTGANIAHQTIRDSSHPFPDQIDNGDVHQRQMLVHRDNHRPGLLIVSKHLQYPIFHALFMVPFVPVPWLLDAIPIEHIVPILGKFGTSVVLFLPIPSVGWPVSVSLVGPAEIAPVLVIRGVCHCCVLGVSLRRIGAQIFVALLFFASAGGIGCCACADADCCSGCDVFFSVA